MPTTYPPTNVPAPPQEDEPSSECLLCLSAPREVVLLPCRHLVACRDCAINMIEFGAGGQIVQNDAPEATAAAEGDHTETQDDNGDGAAAGAPAEATPVPIPTVVPTTNTRRKRKAKGWFCPVCRQRKCSTPVPSNLS